MPVPIRLLDDGELHLLNGLKRGEAPLAVLALTAALDRFAVAQGPRVEDRVFVMAAVGTFHNCSTDAAYI